MKLITSNEQLLTLLPNTVTAVKGEAALFDKMTPFLSVSEEWLSDNFTSDDVLSVIGNLEASHTTRMLATQIVAYDAFYRAIPHLDIILTPNGFGIVSNSNRRSSESHQARLNSRVVTEEGKANVAPASKERVERLMASLIEHRDRLLMQFMPQLVAIEGWLASEQGLFFAATMFPNLEVTLRFPRPTSGSRWEKYLALRDAVIPIEEFFATQYLSKELLEVLRSEVLTGQFHSKTHRTVCRILQAVELRCLSSSDPTASMHSGQSPSSNATRQSSNEFGSALAALSVEHGDLSDIVNTIRNSPDEFPEWHSSATAELYNPAIFENKKESKGYWF